MEKATYIFQSLTLINITLIILTFVSLFAVPDACKHHKCSTKFGNFTLNWISVILFSLILSVLCVCLAGILEIPLEHMIRSLIGTFVSAFISYFFFNYAIERFIHDHKHHMFRLLCVALIVPISYYIVVVFIATRDYDVSFFIWLTEWLFTLTSRT